MIGSNCLLFAIVPFLLILGLAGFSWHDARLVLPSFSCVSPLCDPPFYDFPNFIHPGIVDIGASLISIACLGLLLAVWQPTDFGRRLHCHHDASAARCRNSVGGSGRAADNLPGFWYALMPGSSCVFVLLILGYRYFKRSSILTRGEQPRTRIA